MPSRSVGPEPSSPARCWSCGSGDITEKSAQTSPRPFRLPAVSAVYVGISGIEGRSRNRWPFVISVVGPLFEANWLHGSFGLLAALESYRSPTDTLVTISPWPGSWCRYVPISSYAAAAFVPGVSSRLCALLATAKLVGRPAPETVAAGRAVPPAGRGSATPAACAVLTVQSGEA